jgi:hypothetical protein
MLSFYSSSLVKRGYKTWMFQNNPMDIWSRDATQLDSRDEWYLFWNIRLHVRNYLINMVY